MASTALASHIEEAVLLALGSTSPRQISSTVQNDQFQHQDCVRRHLSLGEFLLIYRLFHPPFLAHTRRLVLHRQGPPGKSNRTTQENGSWGGERYIQCHLASVLP